MVVGIHVITKRLDAILRIESLLLFGDRGIFHCSKKIETKAKQPRSRTKMTATYDTLGFIGLGTMGEPMIGNLVRKLPNCHVYIHDLLGDVMDRVSIKYRQAQKCRSSKEVAEKSVS